MTGDMHNYLPVKVADYTATTLSLTPHNVMDDEGGRPVQLNETDSGTHEAILLAGSTTFTVTLEWENMTAVEAGLVMDFYLDAGDGVTTFGKGAYGSRTIQWTHPTDGHTYVARFLGKLKRSTRSAGLRDIKSVQLLIEGKVS